VADPGLQDSPFSGKIVTIFGSSKPKEGSPEYESARLIGERLASNAISVCTGGYGGTMEAVSKGASGFDVKIIGVTSAVFSPNPNAFVNVQVHTLSLYERLQKLVQLGDGYIILRGGTGTLVEFAMVWELINKKLISTKPIVALTDFWKPVVDLLGKELASEDAESSSRLVSIAGDPAEAAEIMLRSFGKK
jgi:uncharacterized protein (TIGR00725 family)